MKRNSKRLSSPITYNFLSRIGAGCFGEVYLGECVQTGEMVAIKKEHVGHRQPQLVYEMKILRSVSGATGFARFMGYWSESGFNAMALSLLGRSLGDLFLLCGKKFTIKTCLMVADQMISRIEFLHNKDVIHRDIKPENFLIGNDDKKKQNVIYLIDFGLSKNYRDSISHIHIPIREGRPLVGTTRYVSINTHLGIEASRRDDLESLAYMLIYFALGNLPWQNLTFKDKNENNSQILEMKRTLKTEELCEGLPKEFGYFLEMTKELKFDETPVYSEYRRLFKEALIRMGEVYDYKYCWDNVKDYPILEDKSLRNVCGEMTETAAANNRTQPMLVKAFNSKQPIRNVFQSKTLKKPKIPVWRHSIALL